MVGIGVEWVAIYSHFVAVIQIIAVAIGIIGVSTYLQLGQIAYIVGIGVFVGVKYTVVVAIYQ